MTCARADGNFFLPGAVWPDDRGVHINAHGGGMLFHHGNYYWFGEHKIAGTAGNVAHVGVHVYSSHDLYHWKDEGVALAVSNDPKSPIIKKCVIERPKVVYNSATKKFVMWFHLEMPGQWYKAALSGVAISDSAVGPYQFLYAHRPDKGIWPFNVQEESKVLLSEAEAVELAKHDFGGGSYPETFTNHILYRRDFAGGQMARDMTVFQDDDGTAYHIFSSEENGVPHISQLSADYRHSAGKYIRIFPGRFHEAPAMFKRHGKYYLISSDCTGWDPNPARSAMADSIWGPWRELGNPCVGTEAQMANTFESQATYVLPVAGKKDAFIYAGDRWRPKDAIDGRYIWLPIKFHENRPTVQWHERWDLGIFD